jgi:dTDP-4-amino-4,6-dideoxygalactose transaminase
MIPIARPDVGPEEIAAVTAVLESGMLAGGGRVAELEARWAAFVGTKHAIAVSNGTVAEMCIFAGLGLGPGDEVITVGYTFGATVSSIMSTGATPVFVDIERDTYVIDASLIEAAITPRTRAICPVHLFGLPVDLGMVMAIADRHGLAVVEDACQAHGAESRGRRVGSFGHGAFSLYGTKNMTTGEGGLVTTDDDRLADWIRLYRNQGMRERYHHEILGYNFRLSDIAAAIGLCQLDKLERNTPGDAHRARTTPPSSCRQTHHPEGRTRVPPVLVDVGRRDTVVERSRRRGSRRHLPVRSTDSRTCWTRHHADLPVTDAARARLVADVPRPHRRRGDQ